MQLQYLALGAFFSLLGAQELKQTEAAIQLEPPASALRDTALPVAPAYSSSASKSRADPGNGESAYAAPEINPCRQTQNS